MPTAMLQKNKILGNVKLSHSAVVPICLNDHSAFVFRAKQHQNKNVLGLLDHQMKTIQTFFSLYGAQGH